MVITRNLSKAKKINFQLLKRQFGGISTLDALELICWVFDSNLEFITFRGARIQVVSMYDNIELLTEPAADVSLQFHGGPPPRRWWQGTLVTYLMDLFLQAYMRDDLKKVHAALKVRV
jgi:hypothetical protein